MTPAKYEFHPLSLLFPLMEGDELDKLVADIQTNGLQEPTRLYQNEILDGRNRYLACQRAGIEPRFVEFKGTREQARSLVISANIHRRHLSPDQRRALLAELIKAPEQEQSADC
jgi:ParB-like chromosome segregation protein Spo0J